MFYKLLGMLVWKGSKSLLRYKYGAAMAPKPLIAGGIVALLVGGALAARGRAGDDEA
jgi:hypothetical protein